MNDNATEEFKQKLLSALEDACIIIENKAKEEALVDTGTMRRSITHKVDNSDFTGTIGTNVEYAPIVHEKFKPFLQMAFDEKINDVKNCFKDIL